MRQTLLPSSKKSYALWLCYMIVLLFNSPSAQTPAIQWQKALGGTAHDVPKCIYQTRDGGFIVGGASGSKDGDVVGNHGNGDMWVVKLSAGGTIEWQKALGGSGQDQGTLVQQTLDGGYIVGGNTSSSNGDVKGNHGGGDIWVVKLSDKGIIQWQRCLGGSALDEIAALQEVIVRGVSVGFIVGGNTQSGNGDVSGYHGGRDVWVVKLSPGGTKEWQRSLGSSGDETLNELAPTAGGDFLVGSRTSTNGGDVSGVRGSVDLWITRLSATGNIIWSRTLGGSGLENFAAVRPTIDGGCIVGTHTNSNDGDVKGTSTNYGIWIVKLSADGQLTWQKKFDANGNSEYRDVRQTSDGGYVVCGMGSDNSAMTSGGILVARLNANGTVAWEKEYGGSKSEEPYLMQQTSDNGFIISGTTSSPEINGFHGSVDLWLLKLSETGGKQWERAYGGSDEDWPWVGCCGGTTVGGLAMILYSSLLPYQKLQSSDGGYFFAVSTKSLNGDVSGLHYSARTGIRADMWVVKLRPDRSPVTSSSMKPATEPEAANRSTIFAYPNPFARQTSLWFTAPADGRTTIDLYNVDGQKVRSILDRNVRCGQVYTVPLQDAALPKGVYFYRLRNGKNILSGRLVKN